MEFEKTIEGVDRLIESLAQEAMNNSDTYEQAINYLKVYRFKAYEDVTLAVINKAIRIINRKALMRSVGKV